MELKGKKLIVRYKGKYLRGLYVTRSKGCIVFDMPGADPPFHRTFTLKDRKLHWTTIYELSVDDREKFLNLVKNSPSDPNFGYTLEKDRYHIYPKGVVIDLERGGYAGSSAGFGSEVVKWKNEYELIDLDDLDCTNPNVSVRLFSPTAEIKRPENPYILREIKIEYPDIVVLLEIIDAAKAAEYAKQHGTL